MHYTEPGHSGWLGFAGMLGVILGFFHVIQGVIAFFRQDVYLTPGGQLLVLDYNTWGWIWVIIGLAQIAVALGILAGKTWARVLGIVFCGLSMIGQFAFLGAYPVYSVISIAISVLVIYGLIVAPRRASA
ncbi:DUF7144 family membrane protein [Nonomuraea typhae]|uniref:DUF7144 family membrane protein n=1 Tax=Nonomuraea typhae TaxID=2603600 RepID=UPI0012F7C1CB|nr:hypothetical protein [Nonomuraea typhae]